MPGGLRSGWAGGWTPRTLGPSVGTGFGGKEGPRRKGPREARGGPSLVSALTWAFAEGLARFSRPGQRR